MIARVYGQWMPSENSASGVKAEQAFGAKLLTIGSEKTA